MKNFYKTLCKGVCIYVFSFFICKFTFAQNAISFSANNLNEAMQTVTASFSVNAEKQCITGNSFVISNTSSASAGTNYFWDFGDGTTSTETAPTKIYNRSGNFRIHLEVRNGNDFAFVEKFINVMPKPNVSFNTLTGTLNGKSFTYISSSTIESGSMYYYWDLGNGTNSTLINPTVTYATPGNYNVKLIVTSDFGCRDSVAQVINNGISNCITPTAAFTVNNESQCKNGNKFVFTNASDVSSGNLNYTWNFGDGTTSTETNPTKIFNTVGDYTVTLSVINNSNGTCSTTVSKTVSVVGTVAAFVANPVSEQCFKNNFFNFTNESSSSTSGLTYKWNLGDGTTSTETNPTHSYANAGTYTATLIASTSGNSCADTISWPIKVYASPIASFSVANAQQCKNKNFSFTNTSTINSGGVNYSWFFGDGNSSIELNPSHLYGTLGTHTVTLIATSNNGCSDTTTKQIATNEIEAAFVINPVSVQCFKNNAFVFTNESHASTSGLQYDWDLSGGVTATNTNPSRSYNTPGTYNIRLIAKTPSNGCADTIFHSLTIHPSPTVDFNSNMISYTNNTLTVNLNSNAAVSSGTINYAWNFGDGESSIQANPTHVFSNNVATRIVSLKVGTNNGCYETITKTISMVNGVATVNSSNNSFVNPNNPSNNGDIGGISVYPNPAQNFVQMSVRNNQPNNNTVSVKIVDFSGRIVSQTTQSAASGNATTVVTMNVQNLVNGNYFVEAVDASGKRIATNTLVKVK
ncbi:MAG: PKD domain-containing protein [Bacteroidetes bacterium]|nr:PKD domain-containing protein [Bacteroidota bacterium]MBS1670144.1 PKD domain-containing protein [Bacteroidota bacterium]